MRVVVEFDVRNRRRARKVARRLFKLTGKPPEIRRSPTKRGYHFEVRHLPIPYAEALEIRRKCGDDKTHLRFDWEENHKPKSILWTAKVKDGIRHDVEPIPFGELIR